MRRRTLLAASGTALAGLAGCSSRRSGEAPSPAGGTQSGSLDVEFDTLQPAVFDLFVDAYELDGSDGSQYLFLTGTDAAGPARRFRFDGTEHDPGDAASNELARAPSTFGPAAEGGDAAVFELPATGDASDAALVTPDGEWRPDDALRARLAGPLPSLQVGFEGPSSVSNGSPPSFTVTVSNESETEGRFLGLLRRRYGALMTGQLVSRSITAGATATLEPTGEVAEAPTPGSGRGDTLTYDLVWPGGTESIAVTVD
ncbi:hypothetical protein [Haloarcula laminariae]|uniref:hypothetical protein n=1 Tax=Haloarcula laminariae TaxID=2961577 RepID=UPI002405C101|nr:hypothetical protein [Halomicroarcula sp. FL173]